MIFTTPETALYYKDLVKKQRRDQFIALMFLTVDKRESAIAIYALDIELEHVHHAVKEEMIGHIRYAWWRENLEKMDSSDHPVLKALSQIKIKAEVLQPLVTAYSETFPERPAGIDRILQDIIFSSLRGGNADVAIQYQGSAAPGLPRFARNDGFVKWEKANSIINSHRKKYGSKFDSWLLTRLLFV